MDFITETAPTDSGAWATFGKSPSRRIWGLLGGLALLAVALGILVTSSGKTLKVDLWCGIAGGSLLVTSFRVRHVAFESDGVRIWNYWAWFFGGEEFIAAADIAALSLGTDGGKYTVLLRARSGEEFGIPARWSSVKDAQALVDRAQKAYGAAAEVAIRDQGKLAEAAAFAQAVRWKVELEEAHVPKGYRLAFTGPQGELRGCVRTCRAFLRRGHADIYAAERGDGGQPPDLTVKQASIGRTINIWNPDGQKAGRIEVEAAFSGHTRRFHFQDSDSVAWSAVLESEEESYFPFALLCYRGLAQNVGSRRERAEASARQGQAHLVAVLNRSKDGFTVDVADERAWPWVRLALASVSLACPETKI